MFLDFISLEIGFSENFIFVFIFIFVFSINYFWWEDKIELDVDSSLDDYELLNYDLFYKFIVLNEKNYFFLLNLIKVEFKKLILFLIKFRFAVDIFTWKHFIKKRTGVFFVIWRPIFKKWSYLGYYRSNQSKWIK